QKRHWGHCTIDYAVHVARESGVQRLPLFHHHPAHSDDQVDELLRDARETAARTSAVDVLAASEGLCLNLAPPHRPTAHAPATEPAVNGAAKSAEKSALPVVER